MKSALEQLGSYLNNDPQLADVEVFSASEADLHVSDAGRACPGFLGAVDRLGDEVGQQFGEASQLTFRHIAQVGDIYEWHDIILSAGSARRMDPAFRGSRPRRRIEWSGALFGTIGLRRLLGPSTCGRRTPSASHRDERRLLPTRSGVAVVAIGPPR